MTTKDGQFTGKVTDFDAKTQTIKLSYSGGSRVIKIADIQGDVKFKPYEFCCKGNGTRILVLRGQDNAVKKPISWQGIALNDFQLRDSNKGLAAVSLAGVKNPMEIRGIQSVAKNSLYVVNGIRFQATNKMMLIVTPIDRQWRPFFPDAIIFNV